jgi:hypothetical protein
MFNPLLGYTEPVSKINIYDLENQKIICNQLIDNSIFWIHHLTEKKELVLLNQSHAVYYSKEFNFYMIYYIVENEQIVDTLRNDIPQFLSKGNYVNYIICDGKNKFEVLNVLKNEFKPNYDNFDYTLININAEVFTDTDPYDLYSMDNVKTVFTCTNIITREGDRSNPDYGVSEWAKKNSDKIVINNMYSLTYFYHKFGFVYFQPGEQQIEISNRQNKVFLYSKNSGTHTSRYQYIKKALETGKIYDKVYTKGDWFWYYANYNYYHVPFILDYNICKFNLVCETQAPNQSKKNDNHFLSEKSVKAVMAATPAYMLYQYDVYKTMKDYGFYFLNEEFGEYVDDSNFDRFCEFLTNATDEQMDELFNKAFEKSRKNKELLEEYIHSDKITELNILLNN